MTPRTPTSECPFHTLLSHVQQLEDHFGAETVCDSFPLFPDEHGNTVQGDKIVELVDVLATKSGEALVTKEGQRRFGKHSFRSTGAVFLSGLGIELMKIQMMARWASAIITHYTRLAPLKSITADFKRAVLRAGRDPKQPAIEDKRADKILKKKKDKPGFDVNKVHAVMKAELAKFDEEMEILRRIVNIMAHQCRPLVYCQNKKTHTTHRIAVGFE